jgi:predicted 2-oxoglutarate/Fe(II)-dependent dioxygenase YbiX
MNFITYFFIFILVCCIGWLFYQTYYNKSHQDICNDIYNQKDIYTQQKIIRHFLSKEECDTIIQEGDEYACYHGWTTKRHDDYPTTDNLITSDWRCYNKVISKINAQLYPEYVKLFAIDSSKLKLEEIFLAKYDGNKNYAQKSLEPHVDGSEFSFIIALNDNYKGGGTHFIKQNRTVHLNTGDVVLFSGQNRHAGLHVTRGIRYILPGFIYYGKCKQQDE